MNKQNLGVKTIQFFFWYRAVKNSTRRRSNSDKVIAFLFLFNNTLVNIHREYNISVVMYTSTYLATCSENLPLELLRKSRFSPCYGTWSLLSRIQGQSHGSSHTASLQYRFCLKICGMVPTILGVPGQPKQRSATGRSGSYWERAATR